MKLKKLNITILIVAVVGLISYVIYKNGWENILQILKSSNPVWMTLAFGAMVVYWVLEAGALHTIIRKYYRRQTFWTSLKAAAIGEFFDRVTPSDAGGQPMQAFFFSRQGISLGNATSALLVKFIAYQSMLTIYCTIVLIFKFNFFLQKINSFAFLIFIGYLVNAAVIIGLICVGYFQKFTHKFVHGIIRLLGKLRIIKDVEGKLESTKNEVEKFHDEFKLVRSNPVPFLKACGLSLVQLTSYFIIPYFIYRAFGMGTADLFTMIAAGACVLMITSFVPLPGSVGGAEYAFFVFFQLFFSEGLLDMSLLLWRLIIFYMPLVVGFLFAYQLLQKKKKLSKVPKGSCDEEASEHNHQLKL